MIDPSPLSLATLYGVHRGELVRFLAARTGDPGEAEDLVQELWLRVGAGGGAPVANGRAYLYRMAQNLVVDRARERQRRMRRDRLWSDARADTAPDGEPIDPSPDAERALIDRDEGRTVAAAIAALPNGARRAFELHKLEGLGHGEVAARLGISKSGVEKHMAVAMKHLRRALLVREGD